METKSLNDFSDVEFVLHSTRLIEIAICF